MFVIKSGRNEQSVYMTFQECSLPSFDSFGQVVSEGKIFFRNQPIRNKNGLWWQCLQKDGDEMSNIYRGPAMMLHAKFRFIWPRGFRCEDF